MITMLTKMITMITKVITMMIKVITCPGLTPLSEIFLYGSDVIL